MSRRAHRPLEPLGAVVERDPTLKLEASKRAPPVATRDWEAAVGTRIAARARPAKLERGVLLVRAASATWAHELTLLADAIIEQLRARGVAVESLRFFVGNVDPPERPPWRKEVRTSPPEAPLPMDVRRELARVTDPELRDAIARAAAKNLGWQEQREAARVEPRPSAPIPPAPNPPSPPPAPQPTSGTAGARAPRSVASKSARSAQTPTPPAAARRGTSGKR
jgi:hypothetical protein